MRKTTEQKGKKLTLHREPLRRLTSAELSRVRGGEGGSATYAGNDPTGHDSTTVSNCAPQPAATLFCVPVFHLPPNSFQLG